MKTLTIQARLTAWYFLSLAVILALFSGGSWIALRTSMYHSIDRDLAYRMRAVVLFVQSHWLGTREDLEREFTGSSDASVVGVFVQIADDQNRILYQSDVLRSHGVRTLPPASLDGSTSTRTVADRRWPVRIASQHINIAGTGLMIHVVEPLRDVLGALREYALYLALLIVIGLLLTTTAGYWISRRALAPVEEIRKQAEAIDSADLATRLPVSSADDELARLARTLNAMLTRIEDGF